MRLAVRLPSPWLLGVAIGLSLLLQALADPIMNRSYEVSQMSGPQIEDALQVCIVLQLASHSFILICSSNVHLYKI